MNSAERAFLRYLAIDAHKHYVVIGGVKAQLEVVMHPQRIPLAHLEGWLRAKLQATDKVVIEATTNTWTLYDQVARYAGEVVVAHPPHVKLVSRAAVKTDKHDVRRLANRQSSPLAAHTRGITGAQAKPANRKLIVGGWQNKHIWLAYPH